MKPGPKLKPIPESKICPTCGWDLPKAEFGRRAGGKLRSECLFCERVRNLEYYHRLPNKSSIGRAGRLKEWGLTETDYQDMLASQGGGCAICGSYDPGNGRANFCIDHCHTTNIIRGLLCDSCNKGLGCLKDSIINLEKAIQYLKNNEPSEDSGA